MCRNIKMLHHFEPPATDEEIRASALQYVRKLSGMRDPSKKNEKVFSKAVEQITAITHRMLHELEAHGPPHTREREQAKAQARGRAREERMRKLILQAR